MNRFSSILFCVLVTGSLQITQTMQKQPSLEDAAENILSLGSSLITSRIERCLPYTQDNLMMRAGARTVLYFSKSTVLDLLLQKNISYRTRIGTTMLEVISSFLEEKLVRMLKTRYRSINIAIDYVAAPLIMIGVAQLVKQTIEVIKNRKKQLAAPQLLGESNR